MAICPRRAGVSTSASPRRERCPGSWTPAKLYSTPRGIMPATPLKYIAIMGAASLWAPLFWIPAVMRYSNLQGALFTNNDYFVHYAVYPMLACWISVFPLSLATILLFNLIKWNFLWSVIPVTAGTIVLIFVVRIPRVMGRSPSKEFFILDIRHDVIPVFARCDCLGKLLYGPYQ